MKGSTTETMKSSGREQPSEERCDRTMMKGSTAETMKSSRREQPGEQSDRMIMKESMTETMMKRCGREQPGAQSDTTMGSTIEHEHGLAGEVLSTAKVQMVKKRQAM